jgi:alkanesulfonate monooxygenase SsuD/methylene tetrahydromethanopterin reductase-like flavin-dependent oxidoreductase (luciferase family)
VNLANAPRHNKQLTATLAHSKPTRHNILTTKPNQIGHYLQVSTTTTRINYRNFGLAAQQLSFYETIPSYQKVIAREGVASVADLAAVGSVESVQRQLRRYLDAGATDVVLSAVDRADAAVAEELWVVAASL